MSQIDLKSSRRISKGESSSCERKRNEHVESGEENPKHGRSQIFIQASSNALNYNLIFDWLMRLLRLK